MNTEDSKTNESHRFRLILTGKLDFKKPTKNIALANLKYQKILLLYIIVSFWPILSVNSQFNQIIME